MTHYHLRPENPQETTAPTVDAGSRHEALSIFGEQLGIKLTLEPSEVAVASYKLDEWEGNDARVVAPTIPVFATSL